MRSIILYFITLCLLANHVAGFSQLQNKNFTDGEILIQLQYPSDIDVLLSEYKSVGILKKHPVSERFNIYLLEFDESKTTNQNLIQSLKSKKYVVNIQNNHFISLRDTNDTMPNDSLFNLQWSLNNTGQNGGKTDADIDATDAWDITTGGLTAHGDTIVVAIIDGGSDINHEDLSHWINYQEIPGNNIDDDTNGYIDDVYGWNAFDHNGSIPLHQHGTHVGGIVGAKGNNNIGVTGVNWDVKILPVAGGSTQESTVVEALSYVYVVRERYDQTGGAEGAFVVADNCSFGVNEGQPEDYPIWEAMYDSLGTLGILSLGATANRNWDIDSVGDIPTAFTTPYMISVTNTTNQDVKSTNAGYGETTIDLGAPGSIVLSTLVSNKYGNKSGTSMATPQVAGAVALLMSAADSAFITSYKNNPGEAILQIRDHILNGVDTLDDLKGKTVTGGRLNVFNAINLMLDAPLLAINKDSVYIEVLFDSEAFENIILSNIGGDTINYTIVVDGDPDWLELDQYSGSLPSQQWNEITLAFNTDGMDTGTYHTVLEISDENIATRYLPVSLIVYDNVGVNQNLLQNNSVYVYPNPFTSEVNFSISGNVGHQYDIEVYNQSGKLIFIESLELGEENQLIQFQSEFKGLYFYRIRDNGEIFSSGKLLKY